MTIPYVAWSNRRRAWIEIDHTIRDNTLPRLYGYWGPGHPDPAHWHKLQKERFEYDGYRCVKCPRRRRLTIHHIEYCRWGCELLNDVVTLCWPCHQDHHRRQWARERRQQKIAAFRQRQGGLKPKEIDHILFLSEKIDVLAMAHNYVDPPWGTMCRLSTGETLVSERVYPGFFRHELSKIRRDYEWFDSTVHGGLFIDRFRPAAELSSNVYRWSAAMIVAWRSECNLPTDPQVRRLPWHMWACP